MKKQNVNVKRTSYYDKNRECYLDEENQVYVYEFISYDEKGHQVPVKQTIAITKENVEIIKMLDEFDHKEDLQNLYQSRHHELFLNKVFNDGTEDGDFNTKCLDNIPDKKQDIYKLLFENEDIDDSRYEEFLSKLNENQKNLIYDHINLGKPLPQISKESGNKVSVKALEDRWARLKAKAKKFFNVGN